MKVLICGSFAPHILEAIVKNTKDIFDEIWISISQEEKSISVCNIPCNRIVRINYNSEFFFNEISMEEREDLFVIFDGWSFCLNKDFKIDFAHWLDMLSSIKGSLIISPKIWEAEASKKWIDENERELWDCFQEKTKLFIELALNSNHYSQVMSIPPVFEQLCFLLNREDISPISRFKIKWLPDNFLYKDIGFLSLQQFLRTLKSKINDYRNVEKWFTVLSKDVEKFAVKNRTSAFLGILDSGKLEKLFFQSCSWKNYINFSEHAEKNEIKEISLRARITAICGNLEMR